MRIVLSEPDPDWPRAFAEERDRLQAAIGSEALSIEHVGSTSVPGLAAKPILDVLVARSPGSTFEAWERRLRPLGYVRARVDSIGTGEGQWFFRDVPRTKHVHVYSAGSPGHRRHLAFRDALRRDPALRDEYAALKRGLATREWANGDEYAGAKGAFVRRVEAEAPRG